MGSCKLNTRGYEKIVVFSTNILLYFENGHKCLPALYYGLELYPCKQVSNQMFVLNNTFRKIFATKSFHVVMTLFCTVFRLCSSGHI